MPDFFRRKKEKVLLRFGPADKREVEIRRGTNHVSEPELINDGGFDRPKFLAWRYRRTKYKDKKTPIFVCVGPEWDEEIFDA